MRAIFRFLPMFLCLAAVSSFAQIPDTFTNLQVLPKDISRADLIKQMRRMAGGLGVRCLECHVGTDGNRFTDVDFASDKKEKKQRAREMLKMVDDLNQNFFADSERKVSCYTCHHGMTQPRMIQDVMHEAIAEKGIDEAMDMYRAMHKEHYGRGRYDFDNVWILPTMADDYEREGKSDVAISLHRLNLEFHPNFGGSHFAFSGYYFDKGEDEKGTAHLKTAIQNMPDWSLRRFNGLAHYFRKNGRGDLSKRILLNVIEAAPDYAPTYENLGSLSLELGDRLEARRYYRLALEKDPGRKTAQEALQTLENKEETP